MPLTQLEPDSALILIDLQRGIVDSVRPQVESVLSNAAALADAFRGHGRTVVLVNVAGGAPGRTDAQVAGLRQPARTEGWADLVTELGYHVVLAVDAMLDRDAACHEHSIARIFPRLGETSTADAIQSALAANAPR